LKRLVHILFSIAVILSLLICVTGVVFWVRGYFVTDRFFWQAYEDIGDRSYWRQDMIASGRGGVGMNRIVQSSNINEFYGPKARQNPGFIAFYAFPFHSTLPSEYPSFKVGVGDEPFWGGFKRGMFSHPDPGHDRPGVYGWQVVVPYWALCSLTATLPAIWSWRWYRRRRRGVAGCCQQCGYDLRATPDRCPECGIIPNQAATGAKSLCPH
jgi:hypothetical protein